MKIIDLLNKIANGEFLPKKIKYDDEIFIYDNQVDKYWSIDHTNNLYDILSRYVGIALNDEVEIIEEDKKIEKFKDYIPIGLTSVGADFRKKDVFEALLKIGDKINEIIDYINRGEK